MNYFLLFIIVCCVVIIAYLLNTRERRQITASANLQCNAIIERLKLDAEVGLQLMRDCPNEDRKLRYAARVRRIRQQIDAIVDIQDDLHLTPSHY